MNFSLLFFSKLYWTIEPKKRDEKVTVYLRVYSTLETRK